MVRLPPIAAAALVGAVACAPTIRSTAGNHGRTDLAQFWVEPGAERRDLTRGPDPVVPPPPATDATYDVLKRDTSGFSITYRVRDRRDGREWSVKIGPEAQTEVVSARLVWAVGYHEVASYFVERWNAVTGDHTQTLGGARFRPRDERLKSKGAWSWQQNPFVGTRAYNGLLVLMMILNSTDLKNENNEMYETVGPPRDGSRRWYVVKDLGASLGETGRMDPLRGNIDAFEREPFITGLNGPWVQFAFRGRHQELIQQIGPEDVRWTCERLQRLSDGQLREAFHAGGYDAPTTDRYVRRIRAKVRDGLQLASATGAR